MKAFFIPVLVVALTSCATSKPIQGPNGSTAFVITCGSAQIEQCWEESAKVCPGGYNTISINGNPNALVTPMGSTYIAVRGRNKMLIECK